MWGGISLWFWLACPWWLAMWSIFSCAFLASLLSSLELLNSSSVHFLIRLLGGGVVCFVSSLYVLDINPLSSIWFTKLFSHSVGCHWLFLLLCRSFWVSCNPMCWFLLLLFVLLASCPKNHCLNGKVLFTEEIISSVCFSAYS